MGYCRNCGSGMPDGSSMCPICATQVETGRPASSGGFVPKTSDLAVAALVMGVLGLVSYGILGIVGIILGAVAVYRIDDSKGKLVGKNVAIGGIATGGLTAAVYFIILLFAVPGIMAYDSVKEDTDKNWEISDYYDYERHSQEYYDVNAVKQRARKNHDKICVNQDDVRYVYTEPFEPTAYRNDGDGGDYYYDRDRQYYSRPGSSPDVIEVKDQKIIVPVYKRR